MRGFQGGGDLKGEQYKECYHQGKEAHCFGQRKAEDSIIENLLLQGGIACVTNYQGSKNQTDTNAYNAE